MPSSDTVFAPVTANARILPVWALALIGLAFVMVVQIGALPAVIVMGVGASTGLPSWVETSLLFALVLPIFIPLILVVLLWTRIVERRSLSSIGLTRRGWGKYARGYGLGVLLGLTLMGLGALIAPEEAALAWAGASLLLKGGGGIFLLAVALMFVIQSAAEEITFRGWMLSAIARRAGAVWAVVVTSVTFGLVHAQYALLAPLSGLMVMASIALMGAVFAFACLMERSVWGACGAHAAYNFLATLSALSLALAENPELTAPQVAIDTFFDITSLAEYDPSLPVMLIVLGTLALIFGVMWRRSLRRRAQADADALSL